MITDHMIFKASGQYDKEIIQHLNLIAEGITTISNLDRCVTLTDLNLSSNNISSISGLDSLAKLQRLDLSFNRLTRIGKDFIYSSCKVFQFQLKNFYGRLFRQFVRLGVFGIFRFKGKQYIRH